MKELKLLNLYPDLLDLYGDSGNLKILKYRLEQRNYKLIIDNYSIDNAKPDFASYDIIFAGGGTLKEYKSIYEDLAVYKDDLKNAIDNGVFFILINSSYHLFGKVENSNEDFRGLEIFDYSTKYFDNLTDHVIGNIVLEVNLNNVPTKVFGFENHNAYVYNVSSPFGNVTEGKGNNETDKNEGYFDKNVLATHLHGPLLAKNPELSDYILKYCLERKYNEEINLEKLDDTFEEKARGI